MRLQLLLLPTLALAQTQVPFLQQLQSTLDTVSAKIQSLLNSATVPPTTADGAARAAESSVIPLTAGNWQAFLRHSGTKRDFDPPEAWMVLLSGNKTCGPGCINVERAWNESVALFARDVSAPHLGRVDCDAQEILCGAWFAGVPSIWVILLPAPVGDDQTRAPTSIYEFPLNRTTVSAAEITSIHTRKLYLSREPMEGFTHPFDGTLAKFGLTMPVAYVLYYLAKVPSWAFLFGISMFSRTFMSRRMAPPRGAQGAQRPHQE